MNIVVKEKIISLAGLTTLLVQGEIYPEEIRFKFNTLGEHSYLSSITDWKIWYTTADNKTHYANLTKQTSETDETWTLNWIVEANATEFVGGFVFGIVGKTDSIVWKTLPCNTHVAYGIEDITQEIEL